MSILMCPVHNKLGLRRDRLRPNKTQTCRQENPSTACYEDRHTYQPQNRDASYLRQSIRRQLEWATYTHCCGILSTKLVIFKMTYIGIKTYLYTKFSL